MAQIGSEERKTSTILAMDVASYSQKMGVDEEGTLKQLKACREIIEAKVSDAKGRIFNTAGDAFMVEFSNTLSAVNAAILIQREISEHNKKISDSSKRLYFRMGINLGDVMVDGDNLLGDGVNIAARLEGIAPPGGICISEIVYATVKGKLEFGFIDKGEQKLKNIADPVKAYYLDIKTGEVDPRKFKAPTAKSNTSIYIGGLVLASIVAMLVILNPFTTEKDSLNTIVVLPLDITSEDQDQKNLAIGLTQDLSAGLTKSAKMLNVVTMNNKPENLKTLHKDVNASYLISGQLRKAGNIVRFSVNLIEAKTLKNVWTENYDKEFTAENMFSLQDEIVANVTDSLVGNGAILAKEVVKNISLGTKNLSSYECVNFVRGQFFSTLSPQLHNQSLECLKETVINDPDYKDAWQLLSHLTAWGYSLYGTHSKDDLAKAMEAADKSIQLDKDFAKGYATRAEVYFYLEDYEAMEISADKAISVASNDSATLGHIGYLLTFSGQACHLDKILIKKYKLDVKELCRRFEKGYSISLNAHKLDQANLLSFDNYGLNTYYFETKQYQKAIDVLEMIPTPGFLWWNWHMGMSHDGLGNKEKAQQFLSLIKKISPNDPIGFMKGQFEIFNAPSNFEDILPTLKNYI